MKRKKPLPNTNVFVKGFLRFFKFELFRLQKKRKTLDFCQNFASCLKPHASYHISIDRSVVRGTRARTDLLRSHHRSPTTIFRRAIPWLLFSNRAADAGTDRTVQCSAKPWHGKISDKLLERSSDERRSSAKRKREDSGSFLRRSSRKHQLPVRIHCRIRYHNRCRIHKELVLPCRPVQHRLPKELEFRHGFLSCTNRKFPLFARSVLRDGDDNRLERPLQVLVWLQRVVVFGRPEPIGVLAVAERHGHTVRRKGAGPERSFHFE